MGKHLNPSRERPPPDNYIIVTNRLSDNICYRPLWSPGGNAKAVTSNALRRMLHASAEFVRALRRLQQLIDSIRNASIEARRLAEPVYQRETVDKNLGVSRSEPSENLGFRSRPHLVHPID
jgi:hypothetical protein